MHRLYALLAFVVLLLCLCGSLWLLFGARSELKVANGTIAELNSRIDASQRVIEAIPAVVQKATKRTTELIHVIQANPDWGNADVPADVIAKLCYEGTCNHQASAMPASSDRR